MVAPNAAINSGRNEWEVVLDPITAAILAVLPALASEMAKSGVKDAL